jgi:hypothetical protein
MKDSLEEEYGFAQSPQRLAKTQSRDRAIALAATMVPSPGSLFVYVIRRTAASTHAGADQRALPAANQTARARADRSADADTLSSFALTGFRIVPATTLVSIRGRNARSDQNEQCQNQCDQTRAQNS